MIIKHPALSPQLLKKMTSIYVLIGLDHYLINDAAQQIKSTWRQRGDSNERTIDIHTPTDWNTVLTEANSYSLFEEFTLLDVRFNKKTIDPLGKKVLLEYIEQLHSRCLLVLHAHIVPAKSLQWLSQHPSVTLVSITSLSHSALQEWITQQLKDKAIRHDPQVPGLIHQFSQNNQLACAQTIEKLSLIHDHTSELTVDEVLSQLIDHSDAPLYELADACLCADAQKAIHLIQQAYHHRIEPTLILWLLTQEIRQLIQLSHLLKQSITLSLACSQLNIWPKRVRSYQMTLARLPLTHLYSLLNRSKALDEHIKTSQGQHIWHGLEKLALALCSSERITH
jgi:DNA polymerase-3 subunit delta